MGLNFYEALFHIKNNNLRKNVEGVETVAVNARTQKNSLSSLSRTKLSDVQLSLLKAFLQHLPFSKNVHSAFSDFLPIIYHDIL